MSLSPLAVRLLGLGALAVAVIGSALMWSHRTVDARAELIKNYELTFACPAGWVKVPVPSFSLFYYRHPSTLVTLRGTQSQIVADFNPTPNTDRDSQTNDLADVSRANLGWKTQLLDVVECKGGNYRLLRREGKDRTIINAIAVQGNTTIVISLAAIGSAMKNVDAELPAFRKFLASTQLAEKVM